MCKPNSVSFQDKKISLDSVESMKVQFKNYAATSKGDHVQNAYE